MCGIAAWAGKDVKKLDLYKLGTLGIFNEKRGVHSCGLTVDFKIAVGVNDTKVFRDFMATDSFKAPKKYPFAILHTRKATGGAHNKYNAHPFGFGYNKFKKNEHSFVGVHNGSLLNEHSLAEEFDIDIKGYEDDNKTKRSKIDSEILLECIYKSGNYKVLSQYNGAAALVFANIKEPNVIYCFRGASKSSKHDLEEERPLFYWRENMNSLYISSLENSLEAIAATKSNKKNIHKFECNVLYKITNGDINKAEKFKISRANCYKDYITSYNNSKTNYHDNAYARNQDYYDAFGPMGASCDVDDDALEGACSNVNLPMVPIKRTQNENKYKSSNLNPIFRHNIYKDRALDSKPGTFIEHYRTRYKNNGHNITGCYCWIKDFGFYPLGEKFKESEEMLYHLADKEFNNQNFRQVPLRYKIVNKGMVPFKSKLITDPHDFMFYFYDGIMLETKLDYKIIHLNNNNKNYSTAQLSMAATHPIMEEKMKNKHFLSQQVFYKGTLANGTFTYLGCNKIYTFENGNCINIKPDAFHKAITVSSDKDEVMTTKNAEQIFNKVNKEILDNELKEGNKVKEAKKANKTEEDAVKTAIFDTLFQTYNELESGVATLTSFNKSELALKTIKAIDSFIMDMEDIMENDLKIELHGKK